MKLTRLCKAADSLKLGDCPAVYLAEDVRVMVGQGKHLDVETAAELVHVAQDETGVAIPTETVLRAAGLFLGSHGRPDLAKEIEAFVVRWESGAL